jgi:CBS domain-containing protein
MATVADLIGDKGRSLQRIEADRSVLDAVRAMVDANVGSLLVTSEDHVVGIVTERDYLRRVTLEDRDERTTAVREIMSSPLVVITPTTSLEECMALMTDRRIRHLPVAEQGVVTAIVSIGDVVKYMSQKQSFELRYLHEYISAR